LRFQGLLYAFVKFPITADSFCCIEIAHSNDVAIVSIEI
jgi:hypothetical protein